MAKKTRDRKLRKAIRERMARTGERYTTARMHILAKIEREKKGGDGDESER